MIIMGRGSKIGQKVTTQYVNDLYLTYSDYILEKMSKTKVRDLNEIEICDC